MWRKHKQSSCSTYVAGSLLYRHRDYGYYGSAKHEHATFNFHCVPSTASELLRSKACIEAIMVLTTYEKKNLKLCSPKTARGNHAHKTYRGPL